MPISQMSSEDDRALRQRLKRNTFAALVLMLIVALAWGGWRMALGVALGGALGLFNQRWLSGSVAVMLGDPQTAATGRVPAFTASKFILRYFIIAFIFAGAVATGDFHPLGIGVGFAAFVGGVMIEAGYQLYLAFTSNHPSQE